MAGLNLGCFGTRSGILNVVLDVSELLEGKDEQGAEQSRGKKETAIRCELSKQPGCRSK